MIKMTEDMSPATLRRFLLRLQGTAKQPIKEKLMQIEKKPEVYLLKLEKAKKIIASMYGKDKKV